MPSMPMLTMPERSHHSPVIAPSAIGVASSSDSSNRLVTLVTGASDRARPRTRISGIGQGRGDQLGDQRQPVEPVAAGS